MKTRLLSEMKMNMMRNEQWQWTDNQIGHEGAQSLSESLKTNTTLTQINLRSDDEVLNDKDEYDEKWTMTMNR